MTPAVSPAEAAEQLAAGALALDVREDWEWQGGRIAGALHIPLAELGSRLDELPRERPLVAVCRSGQRSAAVTDALVAAGLAAVNLDGGLRAWAAAGLPLDPDGARVL